MTSTPVRRYRNRLKRFLPQRISSRKALLAEFQCALSLLLREIPTPTYDELVTAFGPPERMAQTLMSSTEAPPFHSRYLWHATITCSIIAICLIFLFSIGNTEENDIRYSSSIFHPHEISSLNYYILDDPFTHNDVSWHQPYHIAAYLIEAHNNGDLPTNIIIDYGYTQEPHILKIPAGDTQTFIVNNPCPGTHTLSFDTRNGALNGTIRVFLSKAPL